MFEGGCKSRIKPLLATSSVGTKWAEISAIVMPLNQKRGAAAGEGPD